MPSGFEVFGLVGSINSTIEIVNQIIDVFKAFREKDEDEKQIRLKFELDSNTLEQLIPALHRIQKVGGQCIISDEEQQLQEDLKDHLDGVQRKLKSKLYPTTPAPSARSLSAKAAWALWRKKDLCKLEASLRDWIERVELSYSALEAQIISHRKRFGAVETSEDRIALLIDLYVQIQAREIKEDGLLKPATSVNVEGDSSRRMPGHYTRDNGDKQMVIVEYMARAYSEHANENETNSIAKAASDLVKILFHSNPERTLILRSIGYFHDREKKRFGILYEIPRNEQWAMSENKIATLRDLLEDRRPRLSLNDRLKLCCDIVKSVLYVHLMDFVHKSVRPDNIIFLQKVSGTKPADQSTTYALESCYLAGFEYSRKTQVLSDKKGDTDWRRNIYRHPNRQELEGNSEYNMMHDIYSVGVILLEIGFWGFTSKVPLQSDTDWKKIQSDPDQIKKNLVVMLDGHSRRPGLAAYMGEKFCEVVRYCLNVNEQAEIPGSRLIQEVWLRLDEIRTAL